MKVMTESDAFYVSIEARIGLRRANDWLIKSGCFSDQKIKAPPFFSLTLKPWTKQ
jgi:hypothetical protein